jgi:hypothetical protein
LSVLLEEPPQHVRWAEEAGPMSWIDPGPEPPPTAPLLDLETRERLAEIEAYDAGPPIRWAVPGVTTTEERRPDPTPEVASFQVAVLRLEATDPTLLSPEQALVDLDALMRTEEALRIARLARMTDAHTRRLATLENQPSLTSWVRRRFEDAPRGDIALSDKLRPYVHVRRLVKERTLGIEAAGMVGRALDRLKHHVDRSNGLIDGQPGPEVVTAIVENIVPLISAARMGLADDDPLLIELLARVEQINASADCELGKLETAFALMGRWIPLNLLKRALDEQVDAVLPNQLELRGDKGHASRNMRIDNYRAYGGGRISIDADDELMELAEAVVVSAARRDPENPNDTEAKRVLRENELEDDEDVRFPRTRGQRLHDAFKLVLQQYLAAGLAGTHDKAPVAVTVTLSRENVEGLPGALPAVGGSGRRLPRSLIRKWWCDASVTALVLSKGLIPLGITHEQRTLAARERKASKVQQGRVCSGLRCCNPNDPLTSLVPHHVWSFAKFGKTSIADTIWACDRLHDAIHRGKTVPLRNGRWLNQDGWAEEPLVADW